MDDQMSDPAAWRSAIDPSSGRTYWYHRATRQTTWKMPDCLVEVQKTYEDNGGYKELVIMLDGLATPAELIDLLDKPPQETQFEVLKIIFNCCLPNTVLAWVQHSGFIDKISTISIRTTSQDVRVLALRVLFVLAAVPETAQAFRVSKGWISLSDEVMKWNDINCTILFSYFISLLSIGSLKAYISAVLLDRLLLYLQKTCSEEVADKSEELLLFIEHPNPRGVSLLSSKQMTLLVAGQSQSTEDREFHLLPSAVLIAIARFAFRSKVASVSFCKHGGFSALQLLCTNSSFPEAIRTEGIVLIRTAMTSSSYIQNSVLNSWLSLSTDLSTTKAMSSEQGSAVEITERDIELRSTVGKKSVKIHSALLWARCPGLRGIIEDLWVERRGGEIGEQVVNNRGMEISLEVSDPILIALQDYITSGILEPLPIQDEALEDESSLGCGLLELVKVACELEMSEFEMAICKQVCQLVYRENIGDQSSEADFTEYKLSMQQLDDYLAYADKWGLQLLSKSLATVQYYMSVDKSGTSRDLNEEGDVSGIITGDTRFTPMKFSYQQKIGSHSDGGNDGLIDRNRRFGERSEEGLKHDDLHQQVLDSLEEVRDVVENSNGESRFYGGKSSNIERHFVESKFQDSSHNIESQWDIDEHYSDVRYENSLLEDFPQSSKEKAKSEGIDKKTNNRGPLKSSTPSNAKIRNVTTGTKRKGNKGHGGMYGLLIAASEDGEVFDYDVNTTGKGINIDSAIGDYSALYDNLDKSLDDREQFFPNDLPPDVGESMEIPNMSAVDQSGECGAFEFDRKRHSLVGAPKLTAAEKRLNELSQPKSARAKTSKKKKETQTDVEPMESQQHQDDVPNSETKSNKGAQEDVPPLPSPGPVDVPGEDLPMPPNPSSDIRSSLKLLKSKRRSSNIAPPSTPEEVIASAGNNLTSEVTRNLKQTPMEKSESRGKSAAINKTKPSRPGPTTVAPTDCTRSSGCTCAMCSQPIPTSALVIEPYDSSNRMSDVPVENVAGRETELQRKRKAYNAEKASKGKSSAKTSKATGSEKWKLQSQQLRAAISNAKGSKAGQGVTTEPDRDENGVPFGMVHCDGCGRNFNPESGARHMRVCKDIKAKPKMLVRGGGKTATGGRR